MRTRMMMLALVVPAFVVAGCGGGGDSSTPATTPGGAATTAGGAATATTNGGATKTTKTTKTTNGAAAQAAAGKRVFASAGCGSCHTLANAGSNGTAGPNLDDLQPDEATVANQVRSGGGGMPAFSGQLSSAQIQAVAAYVASVAGK